MSTLGTADDLRVGDYNSMAVKLPVTKLRRYDTSTHDGSGPYVIVQTTVGIAYGIEMLACVPNIIMSSSSTVMNDKPCAHRGVSQDVSRWPLTINARR